MYLMKECKRSLINEFTQANFSLPDCQLDQFKKNIGQRNFHCIISFIHNPGCGILFKKYIINITYKWRGGASLHSNGGLKYRRNHGIIMIKSQK